MTRALPQTSATADPADIPLPSRRGRSGLSAVLYSNGPLAAGYEHNLQMMFSSPDGTGHYFVTCPFVVRELVRCSAVAVRR